MKKIPLFITLDAELDNGWGKPHTITTENAKGVNRFQNFCEKYSMKPIYLTTYEMAKDTNFVEATKKKNEEGLCEIGMHMHGWSTPPDYRVTEDDLQFLPFIIEYPKDIILEKVKNITKLLQDTFETEMVSHRAGRWIMDDDYLSLLVEYGYKIDCSETPLIDWSSAKGDPNAKGGRDYSKCVSIPHFYSYTTGRICEVPMTTMSNPVFNNPMVNACMKICPSSLRNTRLYNGINSRKIVMLRPNLRNKDFLMTMIDRLGQDENLEHVEFMIHTSEVYKNTCPHCHTDEDLNALYDLMGAMFDKLNEFCESITFKEYARQKNL